MPRPWFDHTPIGSWMRCEPDCFTMVLAAMKNAPLKLPMPCITHLPGGTSDTFEGRGAQMPLQPIMAFKDEPAFLSHRYSAWLAQLPINERERKLKWQREHKRKWNTQ